MLLRGWRAEAEREGLKHVGSVFIGDDSFGLRSGGWAVPTQVHSAFLLAVEDTTPQPDSQSQFEL